MVFSSISFIFFLFPIFLLIDFSFRKTTKARNIAIIIFSLFFYTWGEGVNVVILVILGFFTFLAGLVLFRSMEQEYNATVATYQQINNRNIALQRDLAHLQRVEEQLKTQLAALQQENPEGGNEEQIKNQLKELAERILEYGNLYAEWQRNDEEIKQMRAHCTALHENVSRYRLANQKAASAKEQLAILETAVATEQGRFDIIAKALEELRLERSQLLKGKSVDEAEAAVVRREKELNAALEKSRKNFVVFG